MKDELKVEDQLNVKKIGLCPHCKKPMRKNPDYKLESKDQPEYICECGYKTEHEIVE